MRYSRVDVPNEKHAPHTGHKKQHIILFFNRFKFVKRKGKIIVVISRIFVKARKIYCKVQYGARA